MNAQPGKSRAVFVAGMKYKSINHAAEWWGATQPGLYKALKKSDGGPCLFRKTFIVLESWVDSRLAKMGATI